MNLDHKNIFDELNPQQAKAVACLEGPLLVVAGAGSGKTRVLTYRIANLIANGVAPWKILAITFTNKAANEMKSRAQNLIGDAAKDVWLSTFHSFCARFLRREIAVTGKYTSNFAIYDASDSKSLLKRCLAELDLADEKLNSFQARISDAKNALIDVAHFSEIAYRSGREFDQFVMQVYELYEKKLRENNALDFDDLIFTTVKLLRAYPEVLEKYQNRYRYILIDEYQDTNEAQYILTKLLADKYHNICVVGDADQSIYGWRGADMRNILNFEHDYPEATVIKLEQNYRSTKNILDASNAVIANNIERKEKTLWTDNERGEKVKFVNCETDKTEAIVVATEIQRLVTQENFMYKDIAILYRMNSQSRQFEEKFIRDEIPYVIIGGVRFYDRKEIKDILAYLHVIANPRDDVHLSRIVNVPRRGLGQTNFDRLRQFAEQSGLSVMEVVRNRNLLMQVPSLSQSFRQKIQDFAAMIMLFTELTKNHSIDELINLVLDDTGYTKMLKETPEETAAESASRMENLGEFVNAAKDFVKNNPNAALEEFLNHVALITDLDTTDTDESRVRMMTIHAAKGLEFPVVFVVGLEEDILPHASAKNYLPELEEERRACYVAFTRAKKKLILTAAKNRMVFGKQSKERKVSCFVDEIPDEFITRSDRNYSRIQTAPRIQTPVRKNYNPPTAYRPAQVKVSASVQKIFTPPATWNVGEQVNHKNWGLGTVMAVDAKTITISFANPEIGLKVLGLKVAPINRV
ncbi:MAG: UvrD-helicase domain-containing protein [Selenomonadaceae bacterium]|nr:UvrD-helicase domain-containing protein [Selenomonadaceae bacterium]